MRLFKRLLLLSTIPTGFFVVALLFLLFYGNFSMYKLIKYQPDLSTRIYDRNGTLLYQIYDQENRLWVSLDHMPSHLKQATIAMEDHRFYNHPGIDPIAIVRAAKSTFIDKKLQGGSTLTQQYIKNAHLNAQRTFTRKIEEAILATVLESIYTKDQILEKYLNEVPYGGVQYGVETASQYYFGKSVANLTLAESAFLAAITKAPSDLSPITNRQEIIHRQHAVLAAMQEYGFITSEQRESAQQQELNFLMKSPPFLAEHFVTTIKQRLIEEYGDETALAGGLQVITTLDYPLQQLAQQTVTDEVNQLRRYHVSNGAAVIIEPQTGQILSMVGSKDYNDTSIQGQYNVTLAKRQPGSTFKPFVYALAFENGYDPNTIVLDIPTTYNLDHQPAYQPVNYDGRFHGPVTIRQALGNSYNIPATRMVAAMGVDQLVKQTHELGFNYIEPQRAGLSLALGGYEVRPLDLAAAYAAFANNGEVPAPSYLVQVKDRNGRVVYQHQPQTSEPVFSSKIAYLISDILSDNNARTQAFGANSLLNIKDKKVAVKTGTSNSRVDNWAAGYTPDFVVVAWVGNNDHSPMHSIASGITGATPIWRKLTDHMLETKGSHWFIEPSDLHLANAKKPSTPPLCNSAAEQGSQPTECFKPKRYLIETRDGQDVTIEELSEDRYQQFQTDPLKFITDNAGILQADEKPTPIFVKEEIPYQDPLMQKYNQQTFASNPQQTDQQPQQSFAITQTR